MGAWGQHKDDDGPLGGHGAVFLNDEVVARDSAVGCILHGHFKVTEASGHVSVHRIKLDNFGILNNFDYEICDTTIFLTSLQLYLQCFCSLRFTLPWSPDSGQSGQ